MTNQEFIKAHLGDDVRQLALQAHRYSGIDVSFCLQQISGHQIAQRKLPLWASTDGILYPVHLSMEQCSSQRTGEYKAGIAERLTNDTSESITSKRSIATDSTNSFCDLTAGFGVDATTIGKAFEHVTYIERNPELCDIARNNLPLLGIRNFEVICGDGTEMLATLPHLSLIYLDPARRDANGGKVVALSDCTPDITLLQSTLLDKADNVMVKLSPMLDIAVLRRELHHLQEIHIVSVDNECKELLVILSKNSMNEPSVTCANLRSHGTESVFSFTPKEETDAIVPTADSPDDLSTYIGQYLYEPNAALMKAGCYRLIAQRYKATMLHPHSHLYISEKPLNNFPGRGFCIQAVSTLNKRELKQMLGDVTKANLTVRNFPTTVAELRKKLKLKEGGENYLFATTLADESHVIFKCIKPRTTN